jgi:hypothetical protein
VRQIGSVRKHRQAGNPKREIKDLAGRAQPRAKRRRANKHNHGLDREWHWCEWQRKAELRRRGGEQRDEDDRQQLNPGPGIRRCCAHADLIENRGRVRHERS